MAHEDCGGGFAWHNQLYGCTQDLESRVERLERKSHPGDMLAVVVFGVLLAAGVVALLDKLPSLAESASA